MLTAGSFVSSATAVRVARGWMNLWAEQAPPLAGLAVAASVGRREQPGAEAAFRDKVIGMAREATEISWREMRRGIDELDALTRPRPGAGDRPNRPHRVKL
jgi:hypothetical protein